MHRFKIKFKLFGGSNLITLSFLIIFFDIKIRLPSDTTKKDLAFFLIPKTLANGEAERCKLYFWKTLFNSF